jgi:hypothetical protein
MPRPTGLLAFLVGGVEGVEGAKADEEIIRMEMSAIFMIDCKVLI